MQARQTKEQPSHSNPKPGIVASRPSYLKFNGPFKKKKAAVELRSSVVFAPVEQKYLELDRDLSEDPGCVFQRERIGYFTVPSNELRNSTPETGVLTNVALEA